MALLKQYLAKKDELYSQIRSNSFPSNSLFLIQELTYRIDILESFQFFCLTAPVTKDIKILGSHYKMLNTFIDLLGTERKWGTMLDAEIAKKRETAALSLSRVVQDSKKRFNNFKPNTQEQYKDNVTLATNTILSMFIQYRNTYINI